MNDIALDLADVAVGYHARRALRPTTTRTVASKIDAVARRGELTVLLGPNGSGKSTLLRTLCGLQPALTGSITLSGKDLRTMAADDVARAIAVVLTDRVDPGMLSARELAGLGRTPHLGLGGRMSARDHIVVEWALEAVGAAHLADRPASELSDGERQRVLTARALAQEPTLLILDEPTAFLDVPSRVALVELMRRAAREHGLAVVMSTHDLELALRVADHVWLLDRSGRLSTGTPEQLALDGRIGAVFDSQSLRFDVGSGVFALRSTHESPLRARVRAPEPTASTLGRLLGREGVVVIGDDGPADLQVDAREGVVVHHAGQGLPVDGLDALPRALRALPLSELTLTSSDTVTTILADLAGLGPYFTATTGDSGSGDWRPVRDLYTDAAALADVVGHVGSRIGSTEYRVAASTLFLGYAARLWSLTLGGIVRGRILPDIDGLVWRDVDGRIDLHVREPIGWEGGDLVDLARETVVDRHLAPMIAAIRAAEPMSERLLWGNAASALIGAARVLDGETRTAAAGLAETILLDPRLVDTVDREGTGFRRRSCCLFYRTPVSGYCGDCVLTRPNEPEEKEESA
ncbi:iron complex transport system ATP-binding protein [Rhodococcus sp. OK519]|uniref:ATP-binding cassette domain-containing protein n=1 Tax=Rhodococcus sp. OK519 TaxID=2135729 RepID=UPI000D35A28D|nr:iron complex transport system ATP-binding protein [Rhodococcus sp. OK519]